MNKWLLCFPIAALAGAINVGLSIDQIELFELSEKRGDELYFTVTEYTKEASDHWTVPRLPLYWRSKHLEEVKDVSLWQKQLEEGKSVQLILSLVERDVPPWDVDDLIGTVKLTMHNEKGKLQQSWVTQDNDSTLIQAVSPKQTFDAMFGEKNGQYQVRFAVTVN